MERRKIQIKICEIRNYLFVSILLLVLSFGCAITNDKKEVKIPPHYKEILKYRTVTLYGGQGRSINDAIIIKGAINALQATEVIYMYLDEQYPGFILKEKRLFKTSEGIYDCWEIYVDEKRKEKIFFNITDFYSLSVK